VKTYRVGILGGGFMGKVHAYGYRNLALYYDPPPLDARITHVVTSRQETAEKAARQIGADVATTDARVVTENADVDIVHICTPNHLHIDALLAAMRSGKHIYCDKPLTANWEQAQAIAAALPDYAGIAQMTFQTRFFSAIMRAKQLIEQGAIGRALAFRGSFLHAGNANPDAPLKWKLSAESGGGVIADLASHVLDLVDWLVGSIVSVSAATHTAFAERPILADASTHAKVDAEDSVVALTRLADGGLGTIEATKLATGTESEQRLEIHGEKGALRFNQMTPHFLEFHDATASDQPHGGNRGWNQIACGGRYESPSSGFPSPKESVGWLRAHVACLANFLQAVAENRQTQPDLQRGIHVQQMVQCVRQSAASGDWVEIDHS